MGHQPASTILEVAKSLAAKAGENIDPKAADLIKNDSYVDDAATGGSQEVEKMIGWLNMKLMAP